MSLAESICLRAVIKPITLPLKLWLSWKAVLATEGPMRGLTGSSSVAVASMSVFRRPPPGLVLVQRQR